MRPRCPCSFPDELHYVGSNTRSGLVSCRRRRKSESMYGVQLRASQIEYEVIIESNCDVDLIVTDGYQFPLLIRGPSGLSMGQS